MHREPASKQRGDRGDDPGANAPAVRMAAQRLKLGGPQYPSPQKLVPTPLRVRISLCNNMYETYGGSLRRVLWRSTPFAEPPWL